MDQPKFNPRPKGFRIRVTHKQMGRVFEFEEDNEEIALGRYHALKRDLPEEYTIRMEIVFKPMEVNVYVELDGGAKVPIGKKWQEKEVPWGFDHGYLQKEWKPGG